MGCGGAAPTGSRRERSERRNGCASASEPDVRWGVGAQPPRDHGVSARALGPLLVASVLVATGCTSTIVDSTETSVGESTTVITVDLTGTPEELLAQFAAELQALSERIIEHDGQQQALERIQTLWAVLQPDVAAAHPELVAGFQAVV